ncbi:acyl-CoA carboxylase subunit epsilon [Streptomyces sp. Li-HN-5-11]|uniref:acyl-CoA carboxylase subunit epsilon n=1 Tax=Streptomyces sp. Li-HN-5-11 TaxID=3075432 RepID=UPI0028B0AF1A|nr:acyl-CoA carboxylase subunit epsilon [Streptomyces sp. Li-HN-5-11]WNM31303.1 acyl-CoA carboxylase subunit epsilon [Streptomyces sp. Li-HN-5-11]
MSTSATTAAPQPVVRVVRGGELPAEELAALTAVLLSRAAAAPSDGPEPAMTSVVPLWERPGARASYRSPVSWRD